MILISGCSWSRGEWQRGDLRVGDKTKDILHPGLAGYMEESGHRVTNLGIPAGSNLQVANYIHGWRKRNPDVTVDKIFIFQTEYNRDMVMKFDEDWDNITRHDSLCNIMIARFYHRLIEYTKDVGQVYLIGGLSDTLDPDLVKKHYAPLEVVCQSLTNLVVNDDHKIDSPVFSLYQPSKIIMDQIKEIKKRLPSDQLEEFLKDIDRGLERENLVFKNPEYFWPDGIHPNRVAHKKLFDFLVNRGVL